MRAFGAIVAVLATVVLAGSFAGDLHGLGDSLAVFRPVIVVVCLLAVGLVWRWRWAQAVGVACLFVGVWHVVGGASYVALKEDADITIYQKNMLFLARDRAPLESELRDVQADLVTLQEVSSANLPMLEALRDLYPFQLLCDAHAVGAVAILSKTQLIGEDCGLSAGTARAVTRVRRHDVQVISVHLHWPWPFQQRAHASRLIDDLTPLENGMTVIGGDFNMVASGRSLAWFEGATQTTRVGPNVRTFDLFGYPLGIDHVLATGGTGALSVRPQLGSDHYGVLAFVEFSSAP